ncbi:contactin-associated protein-like 4 [Anneissia japonica]|uniref:contactin-associated protein-like 4 n=1 Tax=Anneissia japonica TaxID=1529436 RepID=UPI0014256141|nr:contactin-associated protein-like 4 [Anneissia japonica]
MCLLYSINNSDRSLGVFVSPKRECHHSVSWLYKNEPYAWWVSRDGINMYMWGGGKTYNRTCACGITGICASSVDLGCNCDNNDNQLRSDGGFLVDRNRLPVTKIYIGDADVSYEYSFYSLGPLKCRGIAPPALRSCAEVKAAGFTQTDSYLLDPDGDGGESAFWAYCDLDVYEDEGKACLLK